MTTTFLSRLRFIFRRHLTAVGLVERLRPVVCVHSRLKVTRQPVDANVAFLFLRTVTPNAVLLQKRLKRFRSSRHRHGKKREHKTGGGFRQKALRSEMHGYEILSVERLANFTTREYEIAQVGQAMIDAVMPHGQSCVVDTERVQRVSFYLKFRADSICHSLFSLVVSWRKSSRLSAAPRVARLRDEMCAVHGSESRATLRANPARRP